MATPGAPHCPDYRQTHMARTEDIRPWLRANHLSQPSHIRVHNSHQLSDRDCYYSVPNSSHKLTRKALSSSINCCSIFRVNSSSCKALWTHSNKPPLPLQLPLQPSSPPPSLPPPSHPRTKSTTTHCRHWYTTIAPPTPIAYQHPRPRTRFI